MTLPEYEKRFNKVINDALGYGLPKLCAAKFGKPEERVAEESSTPHTVDNEEVFLRIERLLREILVSGIINKSLICSLFQMKCKELGKTAISEEFSKGYFQDTPAFLANYEIRELKKLRD
jgi:hypothetical protein